MSKIEEFFEKAVVAGCIPQTPMNYDTVAYKIYTSHLENKVDELIAENAELRARLGEAIELPCAIGKTVYTVIKNCVRCPHYNAGWAECRAPATANFGCESTHGTCFTQDIIDDECKKRLCVAKLEFDLGLLDPITGELKPKYFIDEEVAEARLKEILEEKGE